jgi:hypothetical protein
MASVPTRPKGKKRPSDAIGSAVKVIRIASGEVSEDFGGDSLTDKGSLIWIYPGKPAKRVLRPMSRLSSKSSATPIALSP